jgi:hypothetical protein
MRLITLTVRNFRGFGPRGVTINVGVDLVLMFGPNGYLPPCLFTVSPEAFTLNLDRTLRLRLRVPAHPPPF